MSKVSRARIDGETDKQFILRCQREYYRLSQEAKGKTPKIRTKPKIALEAIPGETKKERHSRYCRAYYLENQDRFISKVKEYRAANAEEISRKAKEAYIQDPSKSKIWFASYYASNKDKLLAKSKIWQTINSERILEYREKTKEARSSVARVWREKNIDAARAKCAEWAANNPQYFTEKSARRRKEVAQACPAWADRLKILAVYQEAKRLQKDTGIQYHVDHIVPIKGKTVCGLHVHWNLRPIPALENHRKKNRLIECLLQPPSQLSVLP